MNTQLQEEKICVNCGNTYNLKFCNNCGQKNPHRYSVKHIAEETLHSITHADHNIFVLMRDLVMHPGTVALDFVEGRRKRHFNLFQYLILITGAITFLVAKTNLLDDLATISYGTKAPPSARIVEFQQKVSAFMRQYLNFFQFALLPLMGLCAWLLARNKRFNYAENIVMMTAATAAMSTVSIFVLIAFVLHVPVPATVYVAITIPLMLYFYARCFKEFHGFKWGKSILLAIATYTVFNIMQVVLVTIFVVIYLLLYMKK